MKLVFFLLGLVSSSISGAGQSLTENHMAVDGLDRFYLMFVPQGLDANKKYPLLIVLHGGGGQARQMVEFSNFNHLAQVEKFLVLYPNGYEKGWHDARIAPKVKAYAKNIDDIKFIKSVIKEAEVKFPVDAGRIFAAGISNGAMMSIHLAYRLSEKIRAIASVAGSMTENVDKESRPAYPVSVLVINGTSDKLVPYDGGPVLNERAGRGRVISTPKMMETWTSLNNFQGSPITKHMTDADPDDDCTADRLTYPSSTSVSIQLIRINNGGHTWPGGKQYLPRMIVGNVCRDFKAEEVIWEFFKQQYPR